MSNYFLCYLYSILKKLFVSGFDVLFVLLSLFCCCCIYLYVLYLYDLFHILLLPLQTYGSMECVCACVCMHVCVYVCMPWLRPTDYSGAVIDECGTLVE
jgi:hypothetical protein